MTCPQCARDNPPDSNFCGSCGGSLGVSCPACGRAGLPDDRFCRGCGARLAAAPEAAGAPPRPAAAGLVETRVAREGERKHITVLFADLRGSLQLIADRDPEEARTLLDAVLARMMEAVHRYGGTVNQAMGDGIMALFGAPVAHEDHAIRACYAALSMQETLQQYAAEQRAGRGLDVRIRVGLDSGQVVVRSLVTDLHVDYSAIGHTVHLAARMEQLAEPGTILITRNTLRLARGYVAAESLGPVTVKGIADPVEVYRLTGAGPARSRLQVAVSHGLTPLVGREAELAELHRALSLAGTGRGQVVGLVGEPGVGKSRLIWEFVHSAPVRGWLVLEATATSYGQVAAYLPVVELLRRLAGITDTDDHGEVRAKATALLDEAPARRFLAPLLALLDAPTADAGWTGLAPDQRRRLTRETIRYVLLQRRPERPLCVVVDDLQWVDPETQAVLDDLVDGLPAARVLLVAGYRPEYQHVWGGKGCYRQVRVDPLPARCADQLFGSLAGHDPGLADLRSLLVDRTEGNPLFLEESVRNLVEARLLVGGPGAYRLTGRSEPSAIPDSVQSVLAARIDRLSPADKQLLQAAAVIGKDVPRGVLEAVAELPPAALDQGLRRLQEAEFLGEAQLFPEIEYAFKHALTMEVAAATLTQDRRRRLHRDIVTALEGTAPERPHEHLARLAHHAWRGELWEKAETYCREAGARSLANSAHRSAAVYFDHALEALAHLPPDPAVLARTVDVHLDLRNALSPLGEYRRMLEVLAEAERVAGGLGDERRRGLVAAFLTNFFTLRGEFGKAVEHGERARTIAAALDDPGLAIVSNGFLGLAFYGQGDYRRAAELGRRMLRLITPEIEHDRFGMAQLPSVYSGTITVWSLAELGEFAEGQAVGEATLAIAERAAHPHSLIFACLGLGVLHVRRGDHARAIAILERAEAAWSATDLPAVLLELAWPLASAYSLAGRHDEALDFLERAIAQAVALRHRYGHWLRTGALAEVHVAAGRAEDALPLAETYGALARAIGAQGSYAQAQALTAEARLALGGEHLEAAQAVLEEAQVAAARLGMRPLAARCTLLAGRLARARGKDGEAEGLLARSREQFHALGMEGWRQRASVEVQRTP